MPKRHMKLSDVEATIHYPFRQAANSFHEAFPTVDTIRVEVRPSGEGFEPFPNQEERLEIYTEDRTPPRFINCRNPRCYGGGLDLQYLIQWPVVEAKQTEYETSMSCGGHEGSPKGRRNYGPCDTWFKVKISVTYKSQEGDA